MPAEPLPILIPLINSNEPEALVADLRVREGQRVALGDLLCTLETTKSNLDLTAEQDGFVLGLRFQQGQLAEAGRVLCFLAATAGESLPAMTQPQMDSDDDGLSAESESLPEGLRITQPALSLARQKKLDLKRLPLGPLVTESLVRSLFGEQVDQKASQDVFARPAATFDPTAIIVYGGGGHGKALIDLLRALGVYRIVGIVDDGAAQDGSGSQAVMGVPLLGGAATLPDLFASGARLAVNAVGGIGNVGVRIKVFQRLAQAGFACPALAHPAALVEPSAHLRAGSQVFAHAYVGSDAQIGYGSIINTGAIVSHDCQVGDYANISPGAILAGEVNIGPGVLVGMGATVNLRVKIGAGARIGNGATVKSDVPENGVVRAGGIWPA